MVRKIGLLEACEKRYNDLSQELTSSYKIIQGLMYENHELKKRLESHGDTAFVVPPTVFVPEAGEVVSETGSVASEANKKTYETGPLLEALKGAYVVDPDAKEDIPGVELYEYLKTTMGDYNTRTFGKLLSAIGVKGRVKKVSGKQVQVYSGIRKVAQNVATE